MLLFDLNAVEFAKLPQAVQRDPVASRDRLASVLLDPVKCHQFAVKGDNKREADEYFCLDLFGNSSNSWFNKIRGVGTILNDD
jgi:hypothetical protein